jgi:hypothetical protein
MTNHFDNTRTYARRNAYAAAVQSLVNGIANSEQREVAVNEKHGPAMTTARVQTTDFMYGFFLELDGLDRKVEQAILAEAKKMFPALRAEVQRKTVRYPRYAKFSF